MIKLQDLSELMQKVISNGITFMISQSGLPGFYSINAAYYNKSNKSAHLSFCEKEGVIAQLADEDHPRIEFSDVDSVVAYLCSELNAPKTKNA